MSDIAFLTLYAPLAGATFDSDGVGLIGGNSLLAIPEKEEWWRIQKHDIAFEHWLDEPLPCVTLLYGRPDGENTATGVQRAGAEMIEELRRAILVLRLFKPGWFLDPRIGQICFAVVTTHWDLLRMPGPYRQALPEAVSRTPYPRYEASIADLTVSQDERGPIADLWDRVYEFYDVSGNASAEIAIENFNRSYAFQGKAVDRLASLFMAVDAMFGGMSAITICEVRVKKGGFRQRVEAALTVAEAQKSAASDAAWLDSRGRSLRNAIAHGDQVSEERAAEAQLRLQHIVRLVLRQYIGFASRLALDERSVAERFHLPPACSLAGAYNAALDTRASGVAETDDVLS